MLGECVVKINEVINEGFWDSVKQGAKSAGQTIKKNAPGAWNTAKKVGKGLGTVATGGGSLGGLGKEIAKGVFGDTNVDSTVNFVKGLTGKQGLPPTAAVRGMGNDELRPSHNGEVYLIKIRTANGAQEYFKSYTGKWFAKYGNNPREFATTHPIDAWKDYEVLDKQIAQGNYKIVPVKQDPNITNSFTASGPVTDPANDTEQGTGIVDQHGNPL